VPREQWAAVDRYIGEHLLSADPVLASARQASTEAGLPDISVSPSQGKMLQVLAMAQGPAGSWSSGPSAATARSGWPGRCAPVAG
jgi:predicted O-methyltransferase YrrM